MTVYKIAYRGQKKGQYCSRSAYRASMHPKTEYQIGEKTVCGEQPILVYNDLESACRDTDLLISNGWAQNFKAILVGDGEPIMKHTTVEYDEPIPKGALLVSSFTPEYEHDVSIPERWKGK